MSSLTDEPLFGTLSDIDINLSKPLCTSQFTGKNVMVVL